jgi:PadR family transcriptional regulator
MDFLPGTLDLLVLRLLAEAPLHGYAIARRIESLSQDVLRVDQGSLYPALYRLERADLVRSKWGTSESNRRVKVFRITAAGSRRLDRELESWAAFVEAMGRVVRSEAR